jgi:maleylpyruvate isomerase
MKLFGYWRSSATWRVRIGLHLKGLAFTYVPVHLVRDGGEQHSSAHRQRNPMRQVPVLEIERDGEIIHLGQSIAILEYLDEMYPEVPLLPDDPVGRAHVRQRAEVINAWIQPLQNLSTLQRIERLEGGDKLAWGREIITTGLNALESMVAGERGPYLCGPRPTLADACLIPQIYNARRFGVDLGDMPTLCRVDETAAAHPAFMAAHADAAPDAVVQGGR